MEDSEAFRSRLALTLRLAAGPRVRVLNELLGVCGPEEAGPVALALLDLAIVPVEERPRQSAPRLIRLLGRVHSRANAGLHLNALAALVRWWGRLSADVRHVVLVAGSGRLAAAAAVLAASSDAGDRMSVCALASECGDAGLAPLLAGLFVDGDPAVAGAAERALMGVAFRASGIDPATGERGEGVDEGGLRVMDAEPVGEPGRSIAMVMPAAALERRRAALLGAMALLGPEVLARARAGAGCVLGAWMIGADDGTLGALRNTLRWSDGPLARRRALEWLSMSALGGAALERLSRARTVAEHECVLSRSHLLARPARAARAVMLGRAQRPGDTASAPGYLPVPEELSVMSGAARRGAARYVHATDTAFAHRRRVLEPLLADADAAVRLSCVGALPPGALPDLCFDSDARVARSAMLSWSLVGERAGGGSRSLRVDAGRERLVLRLARSPHRSVRALAVQERGAASWLDASSPAARAAARRRLASEPEALIADLRALMLTGGADERVSAILVTRSLGLHGALGRELLGLCDARGDASRARVAATALAALAELGTDEAARAVQRHTGVAEPRVRANAVEGLGVLWKSSAAGGALRAGLIEFKDDPHHRARANALRALLVNPWPSGVRGPGEGLRAYEPAAVGSLLSMLSDERAMHRLAGAWVAGRVLPFDGASRLGPRWAEVSVRVHEMAGEDADPRVRVRAAQCAGLLRARLRSDLGRGAVEGAVA